MTTTSAAGGDICRLTVFGPDSRAELAVPVHVPLADLLPTLLIHLDQRLATTGLEHGGWVLQRLGEPPLDEDLGTAALGLYDGDIVHLRPRDEQLPPIDFDDIVDGVATAISERADRWRPEFGRRLALGFAGLTGLFGLSLLATARSVAAYEVSAGLALVLLLAGIVASRAFGNRTSGGLLNCLAMAFVIAVGFSRGFSGPNVQAGAPALTLLATAGYLCAAALIVRFTTTTWQIRWEAVAAGSAVIAVSSLADVTFDIGAWGTCALLIPVLLVFGYFATSLSAALVGIKVPPLPTTPDEFQDGLEPEPSASLLHRAAEADRYLTAIYTVIAVIAAGCLGVIAAKGGTAASLFVIGVSTVFLLHCRELVSTRQRLAMLLPPTVGLTALSFAVLWSEPEAARVLAAVALVAVVLLACGAADVLPGRRLIPHWGLAGDITHWLAAAAILPLALQIAGVFSAAHQMRS
ncbi:type VII secretion integral membrane protein EccD [Jatrophihabitans sp. GAS493]|uniref:type VII secretion integral membrane protein EccD n=1 Tax=Jatrophihabitans sp. GAS493 TaxID=1907575 RepID=UPI000BC04138|nr:type VII secretion integral membrane protein EccD [Jatrophihabitans sp. GAS493]SOD74974.1 type VII secretion integral membrane protein EccD [Jatrophihabitans sp. GAS493]